jgi:hypothetical protein
MKRTLTAALLLLVLLIPNIYSQELTITHTDYKPNYRQWQSAYMIDRIDYTDNRIIFHFRFVGSFKMGIATFYGPKGEFPWYLENAESPNDPIYELLEIRNIRQNQLLKAERLVGLKELAFNYTTGDVFTCEIHFARPHKHFKLAHLIEGIGQRNETNHFNAFDIRLKPADDPQLGKEVDMINTINAFVRKHKGNPANYLNPAQAREPSRQRSDDPKKQPKMDEGVAGMKD